MHAPYEIQGQGVGKSGVPSSLMGNHTKYCIGSFIHWLLHLINQVANFLAKRKAKYLVSFIRDFLPHFLMHVYLCSIPRFL